MCIIGAVAGSDAIKWYKCYIIFTWYSVYHKSKVLKVLSQLQYGIRWYSLLLLAAVPCFSGFVEECRGGVGVLGWVGRAKEAFKELVFFCVFQGGISPHGWVFSGGG